MFENIDQELATIINNSIGVEQKKWFDEKLEKVLTEKSRKELYLAYSLVAAKIEPKTPNYLAVRETTLTDYLQSQHANVQQLVRIYLFVKVLEEDSDFFSTLVANIIQVADTGELETFLKFLLVLPNPEYYQNTAVDALRTNIVTVFDAIALKNPYPALYFTIPQWNQMFLKAAFMERDLQQIVDIDKMANKELSKIISDYAHERWKAGRTVDPYFWRPVSGFVEDALLDDMKRLFDSEKKSDHYVAALCCYESSNPEAKRLLETYSDLDEKMKNEQINWETITQ